MPTLKQLMNEHEKALIEAALREHNGNKSHAAKALGVSRRGLLNKLRTHGLEPAPTPKPASTPQPEPSTPAAAPTLDDFTLPEPEPLEPDDPTEE